MIIVNNNNHDLLQLSIFPKDLFLNAHVSGPASFSVIGFFTLNSPMKSPAYGYGIWDRCLLGSSRMEVSILEDFQVCPALPHHMDFWSQVSWMSLRNSLLVDTGAGCSKHKSIEGGDS